MSSGNNSSRQVKYLLPAINVDMGGFPVKQPLPTQRVQQVDPFLLLHHGSVKYSSRRPAKIQGVGPHPHRGFSPVTFVIEGEVHHRDSRGNNQIAKAGEVQWMHSGAGIIHSERPSEAAVEKGGRQEIIQLWINSPAARKMDQPDYQHIPDTAMPLIVSSDGKVSSKLVAGSYQDHSSNTRTQSPLMIMWGQAQKGGQEHFSIPDGYNALVYLIKGQAQLAGYGAIDAEHMVVFGDQGNSIGLTFEDDAQFLLLAGAPIDEEVTQHGPFVMNTQTEILEAMRDYQMGKMGVLIEDD